MTAEITIHVQAPKFEQHQSVWLLWHDQRLLTRISRRWLDWDDQRWWYEVAGSPRRFTEDSLEVSHADD